MKMNALNGGSAKGEVTNPSDNVDSLTTNDHGQGRNGLNDCSSSCSSVVASTSSASYGGARPKTREFDGNIPNGQQQVHQSSEGCSLSDSQDVRQKGNDPTSSSVCPNQHRILENDSQDVQSRILENDSQGIQSTSQQSNNDKCEAGPSQSYYFRCTENDETDASRLAAVCAASSRRAMAERALQAEHGKVKKLQSPRDSDSSSDTGNEDGLSGDECCIYTYKGDQNIDRNNGLLGLSLPQVNELPLPPHPADDVNRDGGSSPEMDFLEMDFDPDALGEQDSIDEDNVPVELLERQDVASSSLSADEVPNELGAAAQSPQQSSSDEEGACALVESSDSSNEDTADTESDSYLGINVGASTSADSLKNLMPPKVPTVVSKDILRGQHIAGSQLCPVDIDDSQKLSFKSALKSLHTNSEPVLDKQKFNLYSALYHSIMANNLILDEEELEGAKEGGADEARAVKEDSGEGENKIRREGIGEDTIQKKLHQQNRSELSDLEKTMIWTEREACHKQVSQIAVSACGAAAVSNVLYALNIPFTLEHVHEGVATRLRAEKACLPTYLFSRSAAGAAHNDLIRGLNLASEGAVYSRFFHMYPERDFCLSRWLASWIKEGAVPIAILNIQKAVVQGATIPDSWHHQMIFGVSHRGIYLTNPLECVSEEVLSAQLCSPSELLVRRQDIVSRWTRSTDLCPLATSSDIRWKQMNVLGQVVNILREAYSRPLNYLFRRNLTTHISIPASYCSGILLTVPKDSASATLLKNVPELPLKDI